MKGFTIEELDYLYDHDVPTLKFKGYRFESQVIDGEVISIVDKTVGVDAIKRDTSHLGTERN
jgi:hypothetical protein